MGPGCKGFILLGQPLALVMHLKLMIGGESKFQELDHINVCKSLNLLGHPAMTIIFRH